ncbi:MAG: exodeoxyribonuclease III [Oscillospiraceae bacterium]|jgi:exodeoxyribonuclease-3|nr:exodeoxyribonuclease III [Oscillospiraceae bacterium]
MNPRTLVSWNVNGIRACIKNGFAGAFASFGADVVCLQEVKAEQQQAAFAPEGYSVFWNPAQKKGYSGTAIFSRAAPLSAAYGLGLPAHDAEGRVIALEFAAYYLVNVYTPNAREGLVRLPYRMEWEDAFRAYLQTLAAQKPVIVCGDLNVAHCEMDLARPAANRMNPGFTDQERGKMTELLAAGFVDTFRYFHPELRGAYSWWSYRMNARARNVGWRIDYFLASDSAKAMLTDAAILPEVYGSDHCPVTLRLAVDD